MFRMVKKYCVIISIFFSVSGFAKPISDAEITHDIAIYAMRSYLNDVAKQKVEILNSQYIDHASKFKENEERENDQKLKEKLAELNQLKTVLEERGVQLNKEIEVYNNLLSQREEKIKVENALRSRLNEAIQRLNTIYEKKQQVISLVGQINAEVSIIDQRVFGLNNLQRTERASFSFYKTKNYLSDEAIVQLKQSLREWVENANRELESKNTAYNNQVQEFEEWQQDQQEAITAQSTHANLKKRN